MLQAVRVVWMRVRFAGVCRVAVAALAVLCGLGVSLLSVEPAAGQGDGQMGAEPALDQLILTDGRVVEGRILEETDESVRIVVVHAGIEAPTEYARSRILRVVRAADVAEAAPAEVGREAIDLLGGPSSESEASPEGAARVYFLELTGSIGKEISPTPVGAALRDAIESDIDYLIVKLDNTWEDILGEEIGDGAEQNIDWGFDAVEEIEGVFRREVLVADAGGDRPEVIFWVRNAMGTAAFLPFVADKLYFHPEGRVGGLLALDRMFDFGDEAFRLKQRSLRLGRAQGIAIAGGYDHRLVTGMLRSGYELYYTLEGGRAVLKEGEPENPGDIVLTDSGQGSEEDTDEDRVRGLSNDLLILRSREARLLGLSSGTVESLEDILADLDILQGHVLVEGRGQRILDNWTDAVDRAEDQLPRLWREFDGVDGDEPARVIGRRIGLLRDMQGIYRRYGEALIPFFLGVPGERDIAVLIEQLQVELILQR